MKPRTMTQARLARLVTGMTQISVSHKSGVAPWRLSLFEKGELHLSDHEVEALSKVYGVNPTKLSRRVVRGGQR